MVRAEVCVSFERSSGLSLITTTICKNEISTDSEEILVEIKATVLTKVIKRQLYYTLHTSAAFLKTLSAERIESAQPGAGRALFARPPMCPLEKVLPLILTRFQPGDELPI